MVKTEQRETETKSEAKNDENSEKMFEEIKALNEKIANLNNMFLKKIQSMEFEKNVVNDLHKELQGYKDDLYFKLIKPTLMDLIDMKNSFKRGIENFSQKTEAEKINFLETFIFEIDTILEKNDIEIYETDITNEQNFNVKKQKIIEKIETDKKENHGKVFKVKSNGYIYKGKVISPEKVEVYVYNEKAKEELKGE
ncbi:nucleotide exchange factor GrpE [Leptotrichia sp. oral taxon 218]|uniref:nucleotide exchange factor GrpE n=1 Tax=Leptotrichia sp. oral taxon 218 TaxID=712361 RepID=UPI0021121F19|nr:nucleotide exchange factor GrpE [Leptotrichia sp. oral taxon 218]